MLIAHLIAALGCGGSENQLLQLASNSHKKGFRHVVISLTEGGPISSELQASGIEVHSLDMKRGAWSPSGMVRLLRLLRQLKPTVLQCWLYHACLMGSCATRLVHVDRLIWALRSANPGLGTYSMQTRIVVRLCSRLSAIPDAIILNSESSKRVHEQWGYRSDKMKVIVNGIDTMRFLPDLDARSSVREELGISQDSLLVGLIARFHPMKDHETFLRAAASVHRKFPCVHFLLAGEHITADNSPLLRLVQQNGLQGRVHMLGPRRDVPRLTAALDLACLSSWSESLPNVVLEAMACAVPCVVTDVGDCALTVGDAGRIVPPKDPLALASAMVELIDMRSSDLITLGSRARDRILTRFSLQKTVGAYEELYSATNEER